jgi:Tfp pilus assembly protein PilV
MLRARCGFTLIEVVVAVVLIDVGLLALVAASAVLVRQTTELRVRSAALHAATNRLQLLGASACVATSGAAAGPLSIHEWWSVVLQPNGVRELRDSVTFSVGIAEKTVVLRTRLPC